MEVEMEIEKESKMAAGCDSMKQLLENNQNSVTEPELTLISPFNVNVVKASTAAIDQFNKEHDSKYEFMRALEAGYYTYLSDMVYVVTFVAQCIENYRTCYFEADVLMSSSKDKVPIFHINFCRMKGDRATATPAVEDQDEGDITDLSPSDDDVAAFAFLAIGKFNQDNGSNYEVVRILRAKFAGVEGFLYCFTFMAKSSDCEGGIEKMFLAKVWDGIENVEVVFCKLQTEGGCEISDEAFGVYTSVTEDGDERTPEAEVQDVEVCRVNLEADRKISSETIESGLAYM